MKSHKVIFQPGDLEVEAAAGSTIMETMLAAGIGADFPCGGRGKCGKCRVRVLRGDVRPSPAEQDIFNDKELKEGIRLACVTKVHGNISVELPAVKQHNILLAAEERTYRVETHLNKILVEVERPSLEDQRSDWRRLQDGLAKQGYSHNDPGVPVALLRRLPEALREAGHLLTAVMCGGKLAGLEEKDTTGTMLGMAFDIGTTTIVGYLLDLYDGKELSIVSALNPQTRFGADVITRITFANREAGGLHKLQAAVTEAINKLIGEAAEKAGVSRSHIYGVSIAANTCMHHLFLGINPHSIAVSPYTPVLREPLTVNAAELKIDINQAGKIFVLPNIAGFIGADATAVLLATELDRSEDIKLIIDIGTNGEIALGSKERILACSAAAGPAFEGAQISSGMRGAVGAIDHVYWREKLTYSVIGGGRPLGICGSALLDAVAGLVELGIVSKRGKLTFDQLTNTVAKGLEGHMAEHGGQAAFLLADADKTAHGRPIMITQSDIRELQLAKGAMAAGVRILMEKYGIKAGDIKEVLLAGAFGNYLNPHSACVIGLIPPELESKIKMIGNAAGTGARLAVLSQSEYRRAADISGFVEFVELGSYPKFNSVFAESMYFTTTSS
ncbi:MAG: ASKHA domain-containing protein [Bacillota bacterium]